MNWEALGAVGEVLGAAGVIVTLLYLSVQIRQNTRQMRGEAVTSLAQITDKLTSELRDDPELLRSVLVAAREWDTDELNAAERSRFHLFYTQEFQLLETAYHLFRDGLLDPGVYEVREEYTLRRLMEPGVQTWWNEHMYFLNPEFVSRMNSKLGDAPAKPASEIAFYDDLVSDSKRK